MEDNFIIEPLELGHADALTDWFNAFVDQDLGVVENFHVTPESEREYIHHYLEDVKEARPMSYIISKGNSIIGKCDIRPLTRYIDKHVVELGFGILGNQNQAGEKLLYFVLEELKKRDYEVVIYFILSRNQYFRTIFMNVGFSEVGVISNFYKLETGYDDRIILEKKLD